VRDGYRFAQPILRVCCQPEPKAPADLRKALAAAPEARALWSDLTPIARRDWIHWITSAKRPETRARRIGNACLMFAAGKRRVCCFDRSGIYSKSSPRPSRRTSEFGALRLRLMRYQPPASADLSENG
jgi:hypothetical protein